MPTLAYCCICISAHVWKRLSRSCTASIAEICAIHTMGNFDAICWSLHACKAATYTTGYEISNLTATSQMVALRAPSLVALAKPRSCPCLAHLLCFMLLIQSTIWLLSNAIFNLAGSLWGNPTCHTINRKLMTGLKLWQRLGPNRMFCMLCQVCVSRCTHV